MEELTREQIQKESHVEVREKSNWNKDDEKHFLLMLWDYIRELHEINEKVQLRSPGELKKEYCYTRYTKYYLLYEGKHAVGFAIVGYGKNCHPSADLYIEEFYIRPKFRRQGYGLYFADQVLSGANAICFFTLEKNWPAVWFWKKYFGSWRDVSDSIPDVAEPCDFTKYHFVAKPEAFED